MPPESPFNCRAAVSIIRARAYSSPRPPARGRLDRRLVCKNKTPVTSAVYRRDDVLARQQVHIEIGSAPPRRTSTSGAEIGLGLLPESPDLVSLVERHLAFEIVAAMGIGQECPRIDRRSISPRRTSWRPTAPPSLPDRCMILEPKPPRHRPSPRSCVLLRDIW